MSFAEIDYFWDQEVVSADDYVDGLEVEVSNWVACEMSHPVNDIEQNAYFGPQRDGLLPAGDEIIELVSLYVLHEQSIILLKFLLNSIVLGYEVRSSSFQFRHNIFLVLKFVLVFLLELRLQLFYSDDFIFLLVYFEVAGIIYWIDEDHLSFG